MPPWRKPARQLMNSIRANPRPLIASMIFSTTFVIRMAYVILYRVVGDVVEFLNVDHHDKIYKRSIK